MSRFESEAAGWEARTLPVCHEPLPQIMRLQFEYQSQKKITHLLQYTSLPLGVDSHQTICTGSIYLYKYLAVNNNQTSCLCWEEKNSWSYLARAKNLSGFCSIPSLPLNWNSLQDKKMNVFFVAGNAAVVVVAADAVVPFSQEFQVLIQNSWDSKPSANAHSL